MLRVKQLSDVCSVFMSHNLGLLKNTIYVRDTDVTRRYALYRTTRKYLDRQQCKCTFVPRPCDKKAMSSSLRM